MSPRKRIIQGDKYADFVANDTIIFLNTFIFLKATGL